MLWLFTGILGGHRFYVGKTASGLLFLFTGGLFFIGWALDFFRLGAMVDDYNLRYAALRNPSNVNNNQNTNQNTNQNNIVINMAAPSPAPAAAAPTPAAAPAQAAAPTGTDTQPSNTPQV